MKTKIFFLFSVILLFLPFFARAATDQIVISEIQAGLPGTGNGTKEFIELYNPTDQDIDLKGTRLVKRAQKSGSDTTIKSWSSSAIIPAKSFYLWTHNDYSELLSVSDAHTGSAGVGFISDNNAVALRLGPENSGQIIDSIGWGDNQSGLATNIFSSNVPDGKSLERIAYTGSVANDFILQDSPNPKGTSAGPTSTPDTPPSEPPPSEPPPADTTPPADTAPSAETAPSAPLYSSAIIISEFLPNPDGSDSGEEWIELYNNSNQDVDLSGWTLDDEGPGTIGKDAYIFPDNSTIKASSYLVINLPLEAFALNNTGGDTVRLFWPDQNQAASVTYAGNVKEDTTYALKPSGAYDWTTLVTKASANQFPDNFLTGITSVAETKIKFNEIFPNPLGPDSGGEWIEIKNCGTEPIYIHNWILDDGAATDPIGSSAYKIQSPTISPGGLAVLVIPAGKFALDNATDTVRLFNENKVLIDSVTYQDAKEGLSYTLIDGKWSWVTPTPNAVNAEVSSEQSSKLGVVINELFPEPETGGEEFIELVNQSDKPVDLHGWQVADLATTYTFHSPIIEAGGFYVLKKSESNIALNNFGNEKVTLIDPQGQVISAVEYEDAPKLQSYNLLSDGTYAWSSVLTPGEANVIKAAGLVKGAILLPRTGRDQPIDMMSVFVIWVIIWYIYISLTNHKELIYEQTRTN